MFPAFFELLMSAEVAGQKSYDVLKSGGSLQQAAVSGTAAGLIEAMTEKIPLDRVFSIGKRLGPAAVSGMTKTHVVKQIVKELGVQGLTEGSEEFIWTPR